MSDRQLPSDERILDLLALRAAEGLDAEGEHELGDAGLYADFDEAAAVLAIGIVAGEGLEDMPASLRARLTDMAASFAQNEASAPVAGQIGVTTPDAARKVEPNGRGGLGIMGLMGWLAAAACLAIVAIVTSPARTPTDAESLALLEGRPGVLRTAWLGLDDAALSETPHRYDQELTGEVVWDDATNQGYMVFEGLAANDPGDFQYQLWIFDAERPTGQLPQFGEGILSQRPVDGGVFDSDGSGRVIVPIDAKLAVGKAAVFAVTVEPPGGVVVSDRDIVTLALVN